MLAAVIRLASLPRLMVFTPDEEYLLYITQTLIKNFHIIWVGVSALGFDYYMGPFWIYFIYPFVALYKGDPIVLGIISSIIGALTALLLYWIGQKIFNWKIGLIASLLYAVSPLMTYYDQQPYPPNVPFLSLLIIISLYMTKYSKWWWVVFSICYGLVFHIHLSLIMLIFVGLYWAYKNKRQITKGTILLSITAFIITVSPLIAFDYFHKGSNITAPLRVIRTAGVNKTKLNLTNRISIVAGSLGRLIYLEPYKNNADEILHPCFTVKESTYSKPSRIVSLLAILPLLYFVYLTLKNKNKKSDGNRLILLVILAFLIPFIFLSAINPVEYYLLGLFPLYFLIVGYVIESFTKKVKPVFYLCLILFVIYGIFTIINARGDFGIAAKKRLIEKVGQVIENRPYELADLGGCHKSGGWRYLFSIYLRKPERSSEDPVFKWLYPGEVSVVPEEYYVMMKETRAPISVKEGYKYKLEEGGFTAYIYKRY